MIRATIVLTVLNICLVSCISDCKKCLKSIEKVYNEGQIVIFESSNGDLDTMKIENINIGHLVYVPRYYTYVRTGQHADIEIIHLPLNKWNSGTLIDENPNNSIINEQLININCLGRKKGIRMIFQFRGSWADSTFREGVPDKFSINTNQNFRSNKEEYSVTTLTWDLKQGLVHYVVNDSIEYFLQN